MDQTEQVTDLMPSRCGCGRAYWPEVTGDACGVCHLSEDEVCPDQESTSTLLDEMVTEAGALGLYESTAEPRPTR